MAGVVNHNTTFAPQIQPLGTRLDMFRSTLLDPVTTAFAATFFSDNKIVGLCLLAALSATRPLHAAAVVVAVHAARNTGEKSEALASGTPRQTILVNALFLALAITSCTSSPLHALILTAVAAPLTVTAALAFRRFLLPWNLPPFVGPYLLVVWMLWYSSAHAPVLKLALPVFDWSGSGGVSAFIAALAHGFSQIFFVMDVRLGVFIALTLVVGLKRTGVLMVLAGLYAVAVGFILQCEPWVAHSGLLAFPAVLAVPALRAGPAPAGRLVCFTAVAVAPLFELAALRMGFFLGIPAFSASYLALMWMVQLARDSVVRFGSGVWSSSK